MFLLQGFGAAFDLGEADLFGVAADEFAEVEFATFQNLWGNDLASEAIEILLALASVLGWH